MYTKIVADWLERLATIEKARALWISSLNAAQIKALEEEFDNRANKYREAISLFTYEHGHLKAYLGSLNDQELATLVSWIEAAPVGVRDTVRMTITKFLVCKRQAEEITNG